MHDFLAQSILKEQEQQRRLLQDLVRIADGQEKLLHGILRALQPSKITGGRIRQATGDNMVPLLPGNTAKFLVTPTFSGAPFTLDGTKADVTSSDTTNFPVALDPSDAQGLTIVAAIPENAQPVGGSEDVTITWVYVNSDGSEATVTASITELSIDRVVGGSISQIV